METLERLPKQYEQLTTPNQTISYCGYTCGKMSVNRVSTILGYASLVIENALGCGYT